MARESAPFELIPLHYYGDVVRGCFILGSLLIIMGALVDPQMRMAYLALGGFGVVAMVVLAGLTSPKMKGVLIVEMIIAAILFLFFQYAALGHYMAWSDASDPIFLIRQAIAIVFLTALYFSTKSVRRFLQ